MQEQGIRPDPSEAEMIQFMNRRADAFERNEIDPDNLRKLMDELKKNKRV